METGGLRVYETFTLRKLLAVALEPKYSEF